MWMVVNYRIILIEKKLGNVPYFEIKRTIHSILLCSKDIRKVLCHGVVYNSHLFFRE